MTKKENKPDCERSRSGRRALVLGKVDRGDMTAACLCEHADRLKLRRCWV